MTTEHSAEDMRYLTEEIGISEEAARLRLRDDDLWFLDPAMRFDEQLQGEEGVRLWEEAAHYVRLIGEIVANGPGTIEPGPAITQLVWDTAARAEEALRRARLRARRAEAEASDV